MLREGTKAPVVARYQALFSAKGSAPSLCAASQLLEEVLSKQTDSVLLRHEACYVLGQLGVPEATPFLLTVLLDAAEHEVVRHEAAEALAALRLGGEELRRVQETTESVALRQTCELALAGEVRKVRLFHGFKGVRRCWRPFWGSFQAGLQQGCSGGRGCRSV